MYIYMKVLCIYVEVMTDKLQKLEIMKHKMRMLMNYFDVYKYVTKIIFISKKYWMIYFWNIVSIISIAIVRCFLYVQCLSIFSFCIETMIIFYDFDVFFDEGVQILIALLRNFTVICISTSHRCLMRRMIQGILSN